MITKISLNNVASFKSLSILETDKKVNLIYGLNGTGKSTISNLLYEPGAKDFDSCFIEGADDSSVLVYNQRFISDNFFESEEVNGIFTLSKTNKDAEQKISSAEKEIKKLGIENEKLTQDQKNLDDSFLNKQTTAKDKIWEIKKSHTGGDRVLEFCFDGLKSDGLKLLNHVNNLTKPSIKPTRSVEEIKAEVQTLTADNTEELVPLELIAFNGQQVEENGLFPKQIVGNSNSSVGEFITKLENSDWVKLGLQYLPDEIPDKNEQCPFCQENTLSQQLITSIKGYFDESYEEDVSFLIKYQEEYDTAIEIVPQKSIFEQHSLYNSIKNEFELSFLKFSKAISTNKKLIAEKVKSPSQSITLESTKDDVNSLNDSIKKINLLVSEHNLKLKNKAKILAELKSLFWENMRWEYDQTIVNYQTELKSRMDKSQELIKSKSQVEDKIKSQKDIIVEQQKHTVNIEEAIANINSGLLNLGIEDFRIEKHSDSFYKLSRGNQDAKVFKTLSEGEKMMISFLYFIEMCKGKKSLTDAGKKKIIVIDDPISSLSHIFIFNVGRHIHQEFLRSDTYDQVFILTHSLYFFYELTEIDHEKRKERQNLFRLRKNSDGSQILALKYEEIQNDYHAYWHVIKDPGQSPALIANCMRNVVEYFFNFIEKKNFSSVFQKAELLDNKYQAFCRYMNRESHSLGQNIFDLKEFDYDNFREAFKLVFVTTQYEEHYNRMMK